MDNPIGTAIVVLLLLGFLAGGCTSAAESPAPPQIPSTTFSPIPPTQPPEPTFTPTSTSTATATLPPTATPLPGAEVFSLNMVSTSIPWLELNEDHIPVIQSIFFNTQIPPFNNALVRQAFVASIDREVIVEMAANWDAISPSAATTFIPPAVLGRDLFGEVGIMFDPDRARELISQAGYTDISSFPTVTLIVNYYGDTAPGARFNMARAMAEMWQTYLGVTVNVETMQPPAFGNRLRSNPPEMFWNGWADSDPSMIDIFSSGSELNFGGFYNPEIDALIALARQSQDPFERQALYLNIERILCEDEAAVLPLFHTYLGSP